MVSHSEAQLDKNGWNLFRNEARTDYEKIIIHLGINNLRSHKVKQFRENALSFFSLAKATFPTVQIFISNILPRNKACANVIAHIPQNNSTLWMIADELGIWYSNTHDRFVSNGNIMINHFHHNGLHLESSMLLLDRAVSP